MVLDCAGRCCCPNALLLQKLLGHINFCCSLTDVAGVRIGKINFGYLFSEQKEKSLFFTRIYNWGSLSLSRATGTAGICPKASWHCVSVSGWNCLINPRSPALFWISVIPYSTACIQMRNHRLLLQSLQRRIVMRLWDGLFSFSGLETEELSKAVNTMEYEVHGSIYQLGDLVYIKKRDSPLHWLSIM
ncbi:neuromedin-S isoform X2 [Aquila chrysaetos chrysaetos]|uniref:neuromedin-S isoform X2 n=1 Tax=Aquila chrysaetos chrysaetos TaxID=223781 RepID=UPI001177189C|nr:neuromedin-S isoform X2 [Aquila chrysaetos chrysaetos]